MKGESNETKFSVDMLCVCVHFFVVWFEGVRIRDVTQAVFCLYVQVLFLEHIFCQCAEIAG